MKILHIVAGDLTGGAAKGAYWLHKSLVDLGIDSKILTNSKITFGDNRVFSVTKLKDKFFNFVNSKLDNNIDKLYFKRKKIY